MDKTECQKLAERFASMAAKDGLLDVKFYVAGEVVTEQACREVLSLPLWPYTPEAAVEEVAARVREFYSAARSPAAGLRTFRA